MDLVVRLARPEDVDGIRSLFVGTYGDSYGHRGFYDPAWLLRTIHSNKFVMLVAERRGVVVGTLSAILEVGDSNDLQALLGRLVTHPDERRRGVGRELIANMFPRLEKQVHVVFGQARTVHDGSQKLCEASGLRVVGLEPLAGRVESRESYAVYARLVGSAAAFRRPAPRLVPELLPVAREALEALGLADDTVEQNDVEGYPTSGALEFEPLDEVEASVLLRIERGRVKRREVFGRASLALGSGQLARANAKYLVARERDVVVGCVGYAFHGSASQLIVFEVIAANDAVMGSLLARIEALAREWNAAWVGVDVSAFAPGIQRTLLRLGFAPVAYLPAMVMERGERLDVVRMARLNVALELGPMVLRPAAAHMCELVTKSFEAPHRTREITNAIRQSETFATMTEGELVELAEIATVRQVATGEVLTREGDVARDMQILLEGAAAVTSASGRRAPIARGELLGEMALVECALRSATVIATEPSRVACFDLGDIERLVDARPRFGLALMRSVATSLSQKVHARSTGRDVS